MLVLALSSERAVHVHRWEAPLSARVHVTLRREAAAPGRTIVRTVVPVPTAPTRRPPVLRAAARMPVEGIVALPGATGAAGRGVVLTRASLVPGSPAASAGAPSAAARRPGPRPAPEVVTAVWRRTLEHLTRSRRRVDEPAAWPQPRVVGAAGEPTAPADPPATVFPAPPAPAEAAAPTRRGRPAMDFRTAAARPAISEQTARPQPRGHAPDAPREALDLERLTDHVVRAIDRRIVAQRERVGRF
jgi:hypothetical protein